MRVQVFEMLKMPGGGSVFRDTKMAHFLFRASGPKESYFNIKYYRVRNSF